MNESSIKVTYWIGLVVRCKSIELCFNEQQNLWKFIAVPIDSKNETDKIITNVNEIQSIELVK